MAARKKKFKPMDYLDESELETVRLVREKIKSAKTQAEIQRCESKMKEVLETALTRFKNDNIGYMKLL